MTKTQAIRWAGGVTKLATKLKIKPQAVSAWGAKIPPLRVYQIREIQAAEADEERPA